MMTRAPSSTAGAPRIGPGRRREIGSVAWLGSRIAGRVTGTEPPAFVTVLGKGRRQFWCWLAFAGSLMPFGSLPRRETEAVILRVSTLTGCTYENEHHRKLGRRAGLTAEQVEAVCSPEISGGDWTPRERVVLRCVDDLVTTGDLDDDAWERLRAELSEREALELIQLVGQYVMLSTTLRVLRVAPDRPRDT